MSEEEKDIFFLKECLKLAKRGLNHTFPNPLVGAVIVKNGRIIGKGYHKKFGFPHAEISALNSTKEGPKGASLYVNLEPCCHFGKTPPCVREIIRAGIKRVVCSTLDPNPKVNGKGIEILKKANIETKVGLLEKPAKALNEGYFTFWEKKRPFVAIKFASSLDGKIATKLKVSKWITNEKARNYGKKLRLFYQAILVGVNTIIEDDPHLGVREKGKRDPIRIILDPFLKIPLKSNVLTKNNVILVISKFAKREKLKKIEKLKIPYLLYQRTKFSISRLLEDLWKREIISILVEGGGETIGSFFDEKIVDRIYAFYSPIIIGGRNAVSAVSGEGAKTLREAFYFQKLSFKRFGNNFLIIGDYKND